MMRIIACGLLVLFAATTAIAQDAAPKVSEIATIGRGEARVAPDRAVLSVTVETTARTATEAAANNARTVASTLASLRAAGVKESELSNSRYTVTQDFENGDRRRPRGFVARNSIRVEVPAVSETGKLIDAALAGGANVVSPIQFLGRDMPAARREALKAAVAEARRDAEVLAEASGGSLGRLLAMSTGIAQPMPYEMAVATASSLHSPAEPTVIRPNDIIVTAVANGRWEFVPRR